jgi:ABC-2 family transporter protein
VIRMTLRQFRNEAIVGFGLLIVLAIVLAITHVNLSNVNGAFQSTCKAAADCATASDPVVNVDKPFQSALPLIVDIAPALIGLFFGAPLIARELESGTFRLAWTQSVTRKRWLAVKLGLVGLAAMTIGGLLTWMVDWWASPIDAANQNRFGLANFGLHGVAPIGYAAFAFALGATAGALLRRTVPAMAVTSAGFAAARLAVAFWVRPNLAPSVHQSISLTAKSAIPNFGVQQPEGIVSLTPPTVGIPNGWVYSTAIANKAGAAPTSQYLLHTCPALKQIVNAGPGGPSTGGSAPFHGCLNKLSASFHTVVTYQPASRFWPFQWAEMGIFIAAALALCGLTYWWLQREYS